MLGKVLKVFNNDLYGKSSDREVILFAAFIHKKYMNKYAIFVYKDELDKDKLLLASIHIKESSLVTFDVKINDLDIINTFIEEYTKKKLQNYELIDISNLSKIEIVGYKEKEYKDNNLLYDLSIPKEKIKYINKPEKSNPILKILLIIFILLGIFITYLYFNPNTFKEKSLECTKTGYNSKVKLDYDSTKLIRFDTDGNVKSIDVTEVYKFKSNNSYNTFKDNAKHLLYFEYDGTYKYIDEELTLKIYYQESNVITNYEKLEYSLKNDGYTCKEVKDEK